MRFLQRMRSTRDVLLFAAGLAAGAFLGAFTEDLPKEVLVVLVGIAVVTGIVADGVRLTREGPH
jgi:hypothetical protein